MNCVVFDIGGTSLRAASYLAAEPRLRNVVRTATPSHWNSAAAEAWHELFSIMAVMARQVLAGCEPDVVSVAFPGPIDLNGRLLAAPTVWGSMECAAFPLRQRLAAIWPQADVLVLNDMAAAGYRYVTPEQQDFCVVTVSSGIGNKVFVAGSPLTGVGGRGGEIGHLVVDHAIDAPVCECGLRGHLGAVASGHGVLSSALLLARRQPAEFSRSMLGQAGGRPPSFDTFDLAAACRAGDSWAWRVVDRGLAHLGHALAAIHTGIGIERFVIIGGFALALGEDYRRRLVRAASANCWNLGQEWDRMVTLGINDDDAGLLGAGRFALQAIGSARTSEDVGTFR